MNAQTNAHTDELFLLEAVAGRCANLDVLRDTLHPVAKAYTDFDAVRSTVILR